MIKLYDIFGIHLRFYSGRGAYLTRTLGASKLRVRTTGSVFMSDQYIWYSEWKMIND